MIKGKVIRPPYIEIFWHKVKEPLTWGECWEWMDEKHSSGYGVSDADHSKMSAHRFSYMIVKGNIPAGLVLDHLCRNRACVNPYHLEPVTRAVNVMRGEGMGAKNARKTHCINGHPLSGHNLIIDQGNRKCRICHCRYHVLYYQTHKRSKNK